MTDYEAVHHVLARYSDAITHRDFAALAELFASDATWQVTGPMPAHFAGDNLISGIRQLVESTVYLMQLNGMPVIRIVGDRATVRCGLLEYGDMPDGSRFENTGSYEDVLLKRDGRWQFASRHFTVMDFRSIPAG